jgi:23S rRNA pseudouridine2605 synthase
MRLLQMVQQQAGISRRQAEKLIKQGKVRFNDETLTTPFAEVNPIQINKIEVEGKVIKVKSVQIGVYKFYKPRGMLCSFKDPHHHYAMGKVLRRPELKGYKIVGRLDRDAEGLLLLTNDGDMLNKLAHPRYQVEKSYEVRVPKVLRFRQTFDAFRQMRHGLVDDGETLKIVRGSVLHRGNALTIVSLTLTEGKNHEVKRLCRHFGWYVERLKRVKMGTIELGKMKPAQLLRLTQEELEQVQQTVERVSKPKHAKSK